MTSRRRRYAIALLPLLLLLAACGTRTAGAPSPDPEGPGVAAAAATATPSPTLRPGQLEVLALDALSPGAGTLARQLGDNIGIAVYVPSQNRMYKYNAEPMFITESVVKVPIMFTVMDKAMKEHRQLTADETALLRRMIAESDNDAATALWLEVGGAPAVQAFLDRSGISGAEMNEANWGDSRMSAEAGATLLGKLLAGEILDAPSRDLAKILMSSVDPIQSWGAVAAGDIEGQTGVKNGWYPEYEGWVLGSIGYVVPTTGPIYTIAIFTSGWLYFSEGVRAIEAIAGQVKTALFSE